MNNLNFDNKDQKQRYDKRKKQNNERFDNLKSDEIKSRNFGNICTRLLAWANRKDKDTTLTAPMIKAIKLNDMDIFKACMTDTMLKKWERKTEIYANFYLSSIENGDYQGHVKLPVSSIDEANESKEVPQILSKKADEYAANHAAVLQASGLDISGGELEIAVKFKEKTYKRKFNMKQVFKVLAEIDQRFYAFRNETGIKPTARTLKMALDVEITDRDLKLSGKKVA